MVLSPDSYQTSFRHVGTHMLLDDLTAESLAQCLKMGRCYVSFDWIMEPEGFSYIWETSRASGSMGDQIGLSDRPLLSARLPVRATAEPRS